MQSLKLIVCARGAELADGLLNGAEGCLLHLRAICQVVGRSIRVWDRGGEVVGVFDRWKSRERGMSCQTVDALCDDTSKHLVDNSTCCDQMESFVSKKNFVELQYLDSMDGLVGHWQTMDGGDYPSLGNNCLFDAVCHQCRGFKATRLRELTAGVLRRWDLVAEEVFPRFVGVGRWLVGGAKYDSRDHRDAANVLDASQGTAGYGHYAKAHPRGHASHPSATGDTDSVENYSRNARRDFPKSAWMSRSDQDRDMHHLLQLPEVQSGMNDLNQGQTRVVVKVDVKMLSIDIAMGHWAQGVMFRGPVRADFVTILLQHHRGKENEPNADVQVFTCYPMEINPQKAEALLPKPVYLGATSSSDQNENQEGRSKFSCVMQ